MRIHGIQVTNLDRVVYPDAGVTKRELFDYFDAVAQPMLVHLESRLLTLVRHPKGVGGDAFFQKHGGEGTPEVVPRFVVPRKQAEGKEPYVYVDAEPALFALVQIGVLEFHVWNSRVPEIDKPDQIVFDLDPGPRVSFAEVIDGAREVRRRLAAIGLAAFVKTTGGKGLHVVAPIVPEHGWEIIGALARILARGMARDDPDRFTSSVAKTRRDARIFVDYMRNGFNRNQIAAYSPRASAGATVSVPLRWSELKRSLDPARFDVRAVPRRVRSLGRDPWGEFEAARTRVTPETVAALDAL